MKDQYKLFMFPFLEYYYRRGYIKLKHLWELWTITRIIRYYQG